MLTPARPALTATAAAAAILLATAACGSTPSGSGASGASSPSAPAPTASPTPSTGTSLPSVPPTPVPTSDLGDVPVPPAVLERPAVKAAVEDAATRQKVAPDEVVAAAFVPVTWNDGSLGCPRKDMSYTQATVEGELLILRVGTALMQYHGRVGGPYTFCPAPTSGYTVNS